MSFANLDTCALEKHSGCNLTFLNRTCFVLKDTQLSPVRLPMGYVLYFSMI